MKYRFDFFGPFFNHSFEWCAARVLLLFDLLLILRSLVFFQRLLQFWFLSQNIFSAKMSNKSYKKIKKHFKCLKHTFFDWIGVLDEGFDGQLRSGMGWPASVVGLVHPGACLSCNQSPLSYLNNTTHMTIINNEQNKAKCVFTALYNIIVTIVFNYLEKTHILSTKNKSYRT